MSQAPLLPANSATAITKSFLAAFNRKFKSCKGRIANAWGKSLQANKAFFVHLWRGEVDEKPKIVRRQGFWAATKRCWPHFLTLAATGVLAWLNIAGFFVGSDFQGCATPNCQTLDRLALQVAAKIMEVLVVASLGVIFVDVLQRELLSEPNGLPLGLLTSKQQFSQIQYLFSPELRFGLSGLSRVKLLAFGFFIVTSAVISLFAGPSAALLLIPEHRTGWPAGGVSMWLAGNDDVLWPSRLTHSDIGGPHCVSPSHELLLSENLSYVDCVWAGLSPIAELYKQAHYTAVGLSIRDGIVNRGFSLGYLGVDPETWASAPHLAVSLMSRNAGQIWFQELLSGSVPETALLSNNGTTTDVPSALLNILVPHDDSDDTRTLMTCSIDARWTKANYRGLPVDAFNGHYSQQASWLKSQQYTHDLTGWQYSRRPVAGGYWRKVRMDNDWLEALTPSIDNDTAGVTSLAGVFSDMGIDNNGNYTDTIPAVEAIVATMVTDGMSRTGFRSVGKPADQLTDPLNLLPDVSSSDWASFVGGRHKFPRPDGPATELQLSMTIGGYAYRADSKAYWLALTVLFLHAALALAHLGYVILTRVFCNAWDSITSFVVLAALSGTESPPSAIIKLEGHSNSGVGSFARTASHVFEHASSGISRYRTMNTLVKIRTRKKKIQPGCAAPTTATTTAAGVAHTTTTMPTEHSLGEEVEMLFGGQDDIRLEGEGYRKQMDTPTKAFYHWRKSSFDKVNTQIHNRNLMDDWIMDALMAPHTSYQHFLKSDVAVCIQPNKYMAWITTAKGTTNATGELAPNLTVPILPDDYRSVHPVYRFEFRNPFVARELTFSIFNAVFAAWLKNGNPKITRKVSYSFNPFPTITHYITPMTEHGNELTEVDVAIVYLKLLDELIRHDRTWPGAITIQIQDNHDETKGYLLIKRKNPSIIDSSNSTSFSLLPPTDSITDPNDNGNSTTTTSLNRPFYVPERIFLELIQRMMFSVLQHDSTDYVAYDIPPSREERFVSWIDPTIRAGITFTENLDPSLLETPWKTVAAAILVYVRTAALGRVWKSINQWSVMVGGKVFAVLWIKRGARVGGEGEGSGAGEGGVATA
ncbi:hypothetical protein Q9189_004784 [Teloschistes chrysophthalmus]